MNNLLRSMVLKQKDSAFSEVSSEFTPNILQLATAVSSEPVAVKTFRDLGFVSQTQCRFCSKEVPMYVRRHKCGKLRTTITIKRMPLSWYSKLSVRSMLLLVYLFAIDLPQYHVMRLMRGMINRTTVMTYFNRFRNCCSGSLRDMGNTFGPHGIVHVQCVEMDEAKFGKKAKFNRGTSNQKYWVFGIVGKKSRFCYFQVVKNRKKKTILPIIQKHVDQSCRIQHDDAKIYANLHLAGYRHSVVNHSIQFKAPDGTHTNTVEGAWGLLRQRISSMHGICSKNTQLILDDFAYRQNFKDEAGSIWSRFLKDLQQNGNMH